MKLEYPLVGEHLFLRTLESGDATIRYLSWLSDSNLIRYLEIRFCKPSNIDDLKQYIVSANDSDDTLMLGIFLRDNLQHVGNIKLGPINYNHSTGDIGLLIGERAEWGRGYAFAAIELLTNYAFTTLNLFKLTAGCYAANEGSRRAFLKAGFAEEGRCVGQYFAEDERQDGILLGKINPAVERFPL